ncbi:ABC multidrug transporter [Colletotrichum karsti]|uniref:ABC multidrug transporter n=1 Tax=Colletotrichum karsti TaxID=1095194 RepID=A0A9P6LPG5_9PEZI|nr:ABC multidrug transporter [Colletotrichum karsti]KAF9879602.1 ABC multidrug transporter [Colletotrichum karsti]
MSGVSDDYFGPQVNGYFDFTVLFEQAILSILPTALLIILAPIRIIWLRGSDIRVRSGTLLWLKLVAIGVFTCLQIVLVALWALPSTPSTRTSVAESVLGLVEAAAIASLSYTEHKRSIRPSALLGLYLVLTIVLDIAQARTLWLRDGLTSVAGVFTASLFAKVVILALEETPKRVLLPSSEKDVAVESTTGVVSRSLFWWLNSLFFQGFRLLIGLEDLGAIDPKFDSARLLGMLDRSWAKSKKDSNWSLVFSTFWAFRTTFLAGVFPRLLFAGFTFAQPLLVNRIVNFVGSPWTDDSKNIAAGLVGATACIYVGLAVSRCWYQHMTFQLVTLFRGGIVSLIFKKTLNLDASAIKDSAPVTLMSVDIENIAVSMTFIHDVWAAAVELPVGIYLLYRQVGPPCFLLLIPGLLCTGITTKLSARMAPARVAWNQGVQKRVSITSSMLNQIKGIKMMGLTDHFSSIVQKLRATELKLSVKFRVLITGLSVIVGIAEQMTPVVIIAAAVFWTRSEQGLSIAEAFTALSIIVLVSGPLMKLIMSIIQLMGAFGCFMRIQSFLLLDELEDQRQILSKSEKASLDSVHPRPSLHGSDTQPLTPRSAEVLASGVIELQSLKTKDRPVSIEAGRPLVTIQDANFSLKDGTEILRNTSFTLRAGTISMVVGKVGSGKSSLLKAILGELSISSGTVTLYTSSVAFCDQSPWLRNVSVKDNVTGQVPYDATWFSAVVRACALDQDISLFPKAENTLVGTGGITLSGGQKQRVALARAVYSRKKLLLLDDVFSGLDNSTSKAVFQRLLGPSGLIRQAGMTVLLATNHVNFLPAADYITMIDDGATLHNQITFDSVPRSVWGHLAEDVKGKEPVPDDAEDSDEHVEDAKPSKAEAPVSTNPRVTEAELTRQTGDTEVYKLYFRSMGWRMLGPFIFMSVLFVALAKLPQIWLRIWTEEGTNERPAMFFGIYLMFALLCLVMNGVSISFWMLIAIPRSARHLHQMLLDAVLAAPLLFFTTTDSGVTLNRFSQDMALIDHRLPMSAYAALHSILFVLAETAIIASGATYVAALVPPSFAALYLLQKYYLRTSRQLRHIDLEAKSPLFTHFTEVLAGLPTLRAFAWRPAMLRESQALLDASQRPYYLFFCVQRWLNVVLDLFVAGMALVLVAFALFFGGTTTKGAIGLAMVNIISFNQTLGNFIEMWTMLETSLGAITRLKYFVEFTPREDRECERELPPPTWPENGKIEIGNATASYSDDTDPVLKNITLTIHPGQKVGICGRSGSGKSSLLLALLRLLDLQNPSGTLAVASRSLLTAPRSAVRAALTTLPQDPVLLPGTVRDNIDPAGHNPDADLVSALRKTRVWDAVEARGGLDAEMAETGLSAGQKQLFCLARAVLRRRRGGVVLLDEATSNVDHATDEEVRGVVMGEFEGVTVVEVAHRLEAIVGYDVVVVMDEGRVVERSHNLHPCPKIEQIRIRSELRVPPPNRKLITLTNPTAPLEASHIKIPLPRTHGAEDVPRLGTQIAPPSKSRLPTGPPIKKSNPDRHAALVVRDGHQRDRPRVPGPAHVGVEAEHILQVLQRGGHQPRAASSEATTSTA